MNLKMKIFFISLLSAISTGEVIMAQNLSSKDQQSFTITIVYDNFSVSNEFETDWGFAAVVETGSTKILFDTGTHGDLLLTNMKKLNLSPKDIDLVILSHLHNDHTGGLEDFLKENSNVKVFYPQSFPQNLVDIIEKSGAASVQIDESQEIVANVISLGEIKGNIPEQAIVLRTSKGNVIITGCAHPGIVTIIKEAKKILKDEPIHLVLGGFHLYKTRESEIRNMVEEFKKLGVEIAAPSHCSGSTAREIFKEGYGENYLGIGVGYVIRID